MNKKYFLQFQLQKKGKALIKPYDISSINEAPEGGARIVTKQSQIFYVVEEVEQVEEKINSYFDEKQKEKERISAP